MTALPETFWCEPMRAKLTTRACAGNYRMANHAAKKVNNGPHPAKLSGRAHCIDCPTGEAHSLGRTVDVPLDRVVRVPPAATPPPPPVTVVPRVEGVLDDKRARPTAPSAFEREIEAEREQRKANARARAAARIAPARETFDRVFEDEDDEQRPDTPPPFFNEPAPAPELPTDPEPTEETPTMTNPYAPRSAEQREAAVADALEKRMTISQYAEKHNVSDQTIRNWLRAAGHEPIGWPSRAELSARAEQNASKPRLEHDKSLAASESEENDDFASCDEHPEHEYCSRCRDDAFDADDDEPSVGDVVHPPAPRTMDRTELVDDEGEPEAPCSPPPSTPELSEDARRAIGDAEEAYWNKRMPLREVPAINVEEALVVPIEIASVIASLDVPAGVAHVIHCLYAAGVAIGRGAPEVAWKTWTSRARTSVDAHDVRVAERAPYRTRGAA